MRRLAAALCCTLALVTATSCENKSLGNLTITVRRPPYPRVRCSKGPAALGALQPLGAPVAGATVRIKPSNLVGKTDAQGRLTFSALPQGRYELIVFAPGMRPTPGQPVVLEAANQVAEVQLLPCLHVESQLRVGFATPLTLAPRNLCGPEWDNTSSYRWKQLEGPKLELRPEAGRVALTTHRIDELKQLPDLPQVLSISAEEAGEYVLQLEAQSSRGERSTSVALVTATSIAAGVTSVAPYYTYYFAGEKEGPWRWKVIKQPPGWSLNLKGEDTRTPSVTPVPPGSVDVQQTISIQNERTLLTFSLSIGGYNLVRRDCGRSECHASMEAHWLGTKHAQSWKRLLDGDLKLERGPAAESCATCHSLGYDRSVPTAGYDDVADAHKLTFPQTLKPGNYAALPELVKETSNVYCLACHGPARVDPPVAEQPGLFAAGVCATCHDRQPEQYQVAQWRTSKHARTAPGKLNGPDQRSECARCHTAQGFYYAYAALSRPHSSKTAVLSCCEHAAPVTCQACHNAMIAEHPAQLHRHGSVQTESGLTLKDVGPAAQCISCHHADADVRSPQALEQRRAPHAPQADLAYGQAGFSLGAPAGLPALEAVKACGAAPQRGCVACHMDQGPAVDQPGHRLVGGHTFRMATKEGLHNARPCQSCHAGLTRFDVPVRADYDGDGKVGALRDEVTGLLAELKMRLQAAIGARGYRGCGPRRDRGAWIGTSDTNQIVVVDAIGKDLGDCDRNGVIERLERAFVFPPKDVALHKAAYNYLVVTADGSKGLHNPPYVIRLLQHSIAALSQSRALPRWTVKR